MAAASPKEKFDAAVNVIQSLPKNVSSINLGSFQPSHSMMLTFYAYYKQATLGHCNISKPAFWDVVGRAKWDAWNKLGTMSRERAMINYVEELKKIIEAMPHTQMVSEFVEKLGSFYELVDEDQMEIEKRAKLRAQLLSNGEAKDFMPSLASGFPSNGFPNSPPADSSPVPSTPTHSSSAHSSTAHSSPAHSSLVHSSSSHSSPNKSVLESDINIENGPDSSDDEVENHCEEQAVVEVHSDPMYTLPVKLLRNNSPLRDPTSLPTNGVNGQEGMNTSTSRYSDMNGDSESEVEEFCDSSDLLQNVSPGTEVPLSAFKPISPDAATSSRHSDLDVTNAVVMRGGGDVSCERRSTTLQRWGSNASMGSQGRSGSTNVSQAGLRQGHFAGTSGGMGGGGQDPVYPTSHGTEINEQIALALVRLQQDMSSVLTRLHTLETLSLAQHQISRSRNVSESEIKRKSWWWPFPNISSRTAFFIIVWPFIVQWMIGLLSRRRHRRR